MPRDQRVQKKSPPSSLESGSRPPLERRSHEATEDYLETIESLIEEKGYAASVDIAERMDVSKPTVTSIVKKLDKQGFLVHEKYRGLKLTPKGKKLAQEMRRKHETLTKFLMLFGIDEMRAKEDAERIEHGLHPNTIEKFRTFTRFVLDNPEVFRRYKAYASRKTVSKSDSASSSSSS